ncbi:MAG: alpha/beta fold hydrolase [Phyllobacterium sp.]
MNAFARGLACAMFCVVATGAKAFEEHGFDSDGVDIRYISEGAGEPVVLIHGYTTNTEEQWIETGVFDKLARHYKVYALDARGHGKSGKPHDRQSYGPQMGQDIVRLLDHLKIDKADIIGYSMGAHIVAQLLTTDEDRFKTAVLGGSSGRRDWTAQDQKRVDIESAEMDEGLLKSQIVRLWPKDKAPPTEEEIRLRSAESLKGEDNKALAAVRRSNPDQVVTAEQMSRIKVPVLGIVGTNDPYLADFEELKKAMPQLELVTVKDASHGTTPGNPRFEQAIESFLAQH